MEPRARLGVAAVGTGILFLLVQIGALALLNPFFEAGLQAVEDPTDPANSVVFLVVVFAFTGGILLVIRAGVDWLLRFVVVAVSGLLAFYVFSVAVPTVVGGPAALPAAGILAALLALALYVYPEWYVIDTAGVIIGAGGAGVFGTSFGPLPAILLLTVLAVYDVISVYRTKHMLTLAESVTALKLPLVLVVPLSTAYSFREADAVDTEGSEPADRDAFFIGLGDTVMPAVMVASAAFFVPAPVLPVPVIPLTVPAATAMAGTIAGLGVLLWLVAKGRAHAGLPLLNGGAIGGYLVGAVLVGIPLVEALGLSPYL